MDYGKYKTARNASWQCLIDYNISELPIRVTHFITCSQDIKLIKNSSIQLLNNDESGMTILDNDMYFIVYKDSESPYRCRFTIAHELGHIFLGHLTITTQKYRTFVNNDENENAANIFARDLLAPACVLHELKISKAEDIARICNISMQAAEIRAERMAILEKRNAWYKNPIEKQVFYQFERFINEYYKSGHIR